MKRAWNIINSICRWDKKPKIEEEALRPEKVNVLNDKEPTEAGKIINKLFNFALDNEFYITGDRGPTKISCYDTFTFTEFKLYYTNEDYKDFELGIVFAWEDEFNKDEYFASAVENEFMYYLMKDHGVTYEAAFNFTIDLIEPDGIYEPINKKKTMSNIWYKLEGHPSCEVLSEEISFLNDYAKWISKNNDFKFEKK